MSQPAAQEDARGRMGAGSRRRVAVLCGSEWRRRGRRHGLWLRAAGAGPRPGGKGVAAGGDADGGGADRVLSAGERNTWQDEGARGYEDRREEGRG